jgi:DNA-binding GntR family transcriptional regulator
MRSAVPPRRGLVNAAESGSLPDYIAGELREKIFHHELRPDEPIRQERIAQELGTSRLPVREALRRLESEGLVVIRPYSGARVAVLDHAECEEIYKIRERIEPLALSESIPNLSQEQMGEAQRNGDSLPAKRGDGVAWLQADRDFHLATYAGIPSPRLLTMIVGFWNTTQHFRRLLLTTFVVHDYEMVEAEHALIFDAVRTRDVRSAEELLRMHIHRSRIRLAERASLFDS